jgi:clan AA aspartic protease (TIGR02281 family)
VSRTTSHTIEFLFKLPPDFPYGGILSVPGIWMKQAEQVQGTPLFGAAVKVTTGYFLIGLSGAPADKDRNVQLLKQRPWFDIPIIYTNNRRAILAIEKGPPGERAFADAFAAWGDRISDTPPSLASPPAPKSAPRSSTSIPLQFEGGTFSLPVLINERLTLDFILDSGAADVSIPEDVVSTLMRTGTLNAADFSGERTYELADGSKLPSQTFRLKSLKIGDRVIENVIGFIAPVKGKLLLGQSFLRRLNSWSIDNQRHILVLE